MNTFSIKQNGEVVLHPKHQGSTPNSGMYIYYAVAAVFLQEYFTRRGGNYQEIYWVNGRRDWSLKDLNTVAEYMGVDKFFLSLHDNTGGDEYKYHQNILAAISPRNYSEQRNIGAYMTDFAIEVLCRYKYYGSLYRYPAFQTIGEEWYEIYHFDGNGNYEIEIIEV